MIMKLVILLWILPITLGDIYVTCYYSSECLLPCTSKDLDIIHWYKDRKAVHSFYHNEDQLGHQSEDYKGRTSLLPQSEIKNGNVSLLLTNIRVQDEGQYKCYTANDKTNDEKFVSVSVKAPIKSVDITLNNDTITCKTSGVYPRPNVSWTSEPPANESVDTFQQTEESLFMVTSELKVGVISSTYKYTCVITNKDGNETQSATLEKPDLATGGSTSIAAIAIPIVIAIVIVIAIAIIIFVVVQRKRNSSTDGNPQQNSDDQELQQQLTNGTDGTDGTNGTNGTKPPEM